MFLMTRVHALMKYYIFNALLCSTFQQLCQGKFTTVTTTSGATAKRKVPKQSRGTWGASRGL